MKKTHDQNAIGKTKNTVAIFDFDNTLVVGDSALPFLVKAFGKRKTYSTLAEAVLRSYIAMQATDRLSRRKFIKNFVLEKLLRQRMVDDFAPAIDYMKSWPVWHEPVLNSLCNHHYAGHHIVIASGAMDLYLPAMLESIPHDAVICTEMEIEGGVMTGRIKGENCIRITKANRVKEYLAAREPFANSWAYGNLPDDIPMLNLAKNQVTVDPKRLDKKTKNTSTGLSLNKPSL